MLKKKIKKLLIGTNNIGKLREIQDLLPKYIKIYSTSDFNLKSPKEDGLTFEENSLIKSKYFSKKSKLPCLADDSGIEIDILDKKPGIYSARWAGAKKILITLLKKFLKNYLKKIKTGKKKKLQQDLFVLYLFIILIKKLHL